MLVKPKLSFDEIKGWVFTGLPAGIDGVIENIVIY